MFDCLCVDECVNYGRVSSPAVCGTGRVGTGQAGHRVKTLVREDFCVKFNAALPKLPRFQSLKVRGS